MPAIAKLSHESVSSGLIRAIQRGLAASGLERREFCMRTGIREDELKDNVRIDACRYSHVQDLLRQFLSEGMPLYRPSMSTLLDDVPHLASLWCNSPTLAAALQHYCDYRGLLGTPDLMSLHVHGDELELCYVPERCGEGGAIGCDSAVGNFVLVMSIDLRALRAGPPRAPPRALRSSSRATTARPRARAPRRAGGPARSSP